MPAMNGIGRQPQRDQMVQTQLVPRGIHDARVLAALREVPREAFVPEEQRGEAYADCALPIGEGQTISQPYIVARSCELAAIAPGDRVLEVGAGSGYQAAVLSRLAAQVVAIERLPELAAQARSTLQRLGIDNVALITGDGSLGHPERAPYAAIVVAAGTDQISPAWLEQLAEGGRLVLPLGPRHSQALTVITRRGEGYTREVHDRCLFVPLISGECG